MRRIITYILLLCGAVFLQGCVYDSLRPEDCAATADKYYLSVALRSYGDQLLQTKAGEAQPPYGDAATLSEQLVSTLDLYFYSKAGAYLEKRTATDFEQTAGVFLVQLTYRPYWMIVTVNSDQDLSRKTLSEARAVIQSGSASWAEAGRSIQYQGAAQQVAPLRMTSSTYINAAGEETCAVPVNAKYLMEDADEARNNPMTVPLDRLAAKVTLAAPAATSFAVPVATTEQGVLDARVELLGWGLNALNTRSYLFKKIDPAWTFPTWTVAWNEPSRLRSHWAQDPNYGDPLASGYDGGAYPASVADLQPAGNLAPGDCALEYLSWNQLDAAFGTDSRYCLENTADGSILATARSANQLYPRVTHVLVKARLSFGLAAGKTAADDTDGYCSAGEFFRYGGVFYTADGMKRTILSSMQLYTDDARTQAATPADLDWKALGGERLQPVAAAGVTLYGDTAALAALTVDGFKDGQFYYKIPVEHLTPAEQTPGANYPTAQYGVVRNHNYTISLGSVEGLGTGVWDETEKIVPVTRELEYRLSAQVTVSPWKVLEQRFLFMDPSGMIIPGGQNVDEWDDYDNNQWNGWYE
ncbi:MAG: Mfa1 family fimbria major subunit [Bacteroidales bacterium]|nr:Mfa1 family fimbria major subunit [Bacteroidales bacterium]